MVSLTARAQVRSIPDLLLPTGSDPGVTQFQSLLGTASGLRMHDPLVRQVALRIGFNGNSLGDSLLGYIRNEDAYRLQVGFNSLQERNRQKDIKNAGVGLLNAEYGWIQQQRPRQRLQHRLPGSLLCLHWRPAGNWILFLFGNKLSCVKCYRQGWGR
jgi:hypothetical protein